MPNRNASRSPSTAPNLNPTGIVLLEFDRRRDELGSGKELRDGLSVAVQIGKTLWVANDETVSVERLTLADAPRQGTSRSAGHHRQFSLGDYLELPAPPAKDPAELQEADLEGMDYADGYLWLVSSHSLKRKSPAPGDSPKAARKMLATLTTDGNRYLLARIPVVDKDGAPSLAKKSSRKGTKRAAAQLRGDDKGNDLTDAFRKDDQLAQFLGIPGKENGLDIEGLAVHGQRLFVGLRGPVLRGWSIILELELQEVRDRPGTLKLKPIGPDKNPMYRKHFLQLGGLGVRDLCRDGADLFILAGPTMQLDGPVTLFRWRGGAAPAAESVVGADQLDAVLQVPFGAGVDHAEGIALLSPAEGQARSLLVVYDSASARRQIGESALLADVFALPNFALPKSR